jgi:hypothetical protein
MADSSSPRENNSFRYYATGATFVTSRLHMLKISGALLISNQSLKQNNAE